MKEIEGRLRSYMDAPWAKAPKAYQNIVHEDENVIVVKDGVTVTEGHLLFVPKKVKRQLDITRCFELAYKWGVRGVCDYKWVAFNVGINNGVEAGQSVMWPHVHLIPRRKGDVEDPKRVKGGVRHVIPFKGNYCDEDSTCPIVDDNTSREELDNWKKRYKGYREWKKKIPMKELTRLEEEYNGCFDDRNWFDKDSRMV